MLARNRTFLSGVMALFFLALTFVLVRAGLRFELTEQNYWIGYLGLGILLGVAYLSVHFLLKTLLFEKPRLARVCSQVIAALIAVPLTILAFLLSFFVINEMIMTGTETYDYLVDLSVVLLFVDCPAFFLWRYALKGLTGEQNNSVN